MEVKDEQINPMKVSSTETEGNLFLSNPPALGLTAATESNERSDDLLLNGTPQITPVEDRKNNADESNRCRFCAQEFATSRSRNRHEKTVHDGVLAFKCVPCDKNFRDAYDLRRHQQRHHSKTPKGEQIIPANFSSIEAERDESSERLADWLSNAIDQIAAEDDQKRNQDESNRCRFCANQFATPGKRDRHEKTVHRGVLTFNCTFCHKNFRDSYDLRRHQERNHGREPKLPTRGHFKCDVCDMNFRDAYALRHHQGGLQTCQPKDTLGSFKCDICDEEFTDSNLLKSHRVSCKERCAHCGQSCRTAYDLKRHLKRVHGKLPNGTLQSFKCDVCHKVFSGSGRLKQHQMFCKSSSCDKAALPSKSEVINGDRMISPGEQMASATVSSEVLKPAADVEGAAVADHPSRDLTFSRCAFCSAEFADLRNKARHENSVHQGILPFRCAVCAKCFRAAWDLRRHLQRSHGQEKQQAIRRFNYCAFCNKLILNSYNLRSHEARCKARQNKAHAGRQRLRRRVKHPNDDASMPSRGDVARCEQINPTLTESSNTVKPFDQKVKTEPCSDGGIPGESLMGLDKVKLEPISDDELSAVTPGHSGDTFPLLRKESSHPTSSKRLQNSATMSDFLCRFCRKSFGFASARDRHEQSVHLKIYRFSCSFCDAKFLGLVPKLAHEQSVHCGGNAWRLQSNTAAGECCTILADASSAAQEKSSEPNACDSNICAENEDAVFDAGFYNEEDVDTSQNYGIERNNYSSGHLNMPFYANMPNFACEACGEAFTFEHEMRAHACETAMQ